MGKSAVWGDTVISGTAVGKVSIFEFGVGSVVSVDIAN